MDELERLHQGQFWLVGQLCFSRYEIAILRGESHNVAYAAAVDTINMYLDVMEQIDTSAGKELKDHILRLVDILISTARRTEEMS